ncbi:dirigent protein 22-like isoform X1 [Carex littledalei]|uniref:Dirigent protein n=1 Tax=Carex littledalei TaxID=544730 RepID=A0A833VWJ9_9POAL|nr:dirigent protein 22-like isoform X1 [Carex littledalei]
MATCICTTFSYLLLFLTSAANLALVNSSDSADAYLSHFRFYWHDIVSGHNPTSVRVAEAPGTNTSSTLFGTVFMIDDPLTTGPDMDSKLVGRAQGFYGFAGLKKTGLLMAMNIVLIDGKYNGSTITILGHNDVVSAVREMPIVDGSGLFRFARGYVVLHTVVVKNRNAVVEYNVFVNHY